jgi:hypothetical protein
LNDICLIILIKKIHMLSGKLVMIKRKMPTRKQYLNNFVVAVHYYSIVQHFIVIMLLRIYYDDGSTHF